MTTKAATGLLLRLAGLLGLPGVVWLLAGLAPEAPVAAPHGPWADQLRGPDTPVQLHISPDAVVSTGKQSSLEFSVSLSSTQACNVLLQPELTSVDGKVKRRLERKRLAISQHQTGGASFSLGTNGLRDAAYSLRVAYAWKCGDGEKGAGSREQGVAVSGGVPNPLGPDELHYAAVGEEEVAP